MTISPNEAPLELGGLVLVVSEICARRYGAGRVREGSTRGKSRLVGRSAAVAAAGVAEAIAKGRGLDGRGIVDQHKSRTKSEKYI